MKQYHRIMIAFFLVFLICVGGVDLFYEQVLTKKQERSYEVEINRLSEQILSGKQLTPEPIQYDTKELKQAGYQYITKVTVQTDGNQQNFFYGENSYYAIRVLDGVLYRFDYQPAYQDQVQEIVILYHILIVALALMTLFILLYVKRKIIAPFTKIQGLPYELSKGNLNAGLKENKSRYFGKFIWGLDLLRQHLESEKRKELSLQKEKKTLILSLSHDIKTPLSAIKLYSQALTKNLYPDAERQKELYSLLSMKADEIERYVVQIMQASKEDFMQIDVADGEFYLKDLLNHIHTYYQDRLGLLKIGFHISAYQNCLLCGDYDRAVEVIQNLMENAIKYGDQKAIEIQMSREEGYQLVAVINSGCQLTETELPHIFESFWRGSNVKQQQGSGLGLYICRQIMIKSKGDIFAECKDGNMRVTAVFRMS